MTVGSREEGSFLPQIDGGGRGAYTRPESLNEDSCTAFTMIH